MIELGLQLLYVGCFHCLQLFLCNGMLYGDGHEPVIVVVFDPASDCQLWVHNFVLLDLLMLAIATGLPVLQVVLAAPNVPEFGELPVLSKVKRVCAMLLALWCAKVYAVGEMPSLWSNLRVAFIWALSWWLWR